MKSQDNNWMSISDMMSALMIIFMFISIAFMLKVQHQQKAMNEIIQEYASIKIDIYDDLYKEFKEDLPKWDAEIDKKTLSVRFLEPEVLFSVGSSEMNGKFKKIMDDFFPRYINVLSQKKYKDIIQEIRIEGHTSSEWQGQKGTMDAYFKNMELSQARTRSVLMYVLNLYEIKNYRDWLIKRITANGLSFSQRIWTESGIEDYEKSRRVEFRIRTNADEKMDKLDEGSKK